MPRLRLSPQGLECQRPLLSALAVEARPSPLPGQLSLCTGLLLQILGLLERHATDGPQHSAGMLAARDGRGVIAAVRHIECHYAEPLTLPEIARAIGYGATYLSREIARQLARAPHVRLWHGQVLIKNPGDSRAPPWHRDFPYWPMREIGGLSCWMALNDVDEANGCMAFVPGSQWFGVLEPIRLDNPQDPFGLVSPDSRGELALRGLFQPMKAGSCTFHYAGPNATERPRRALITIYMPGDVHFTGADHPVTQGLGLKEGDVLAGERFPILAAAPAAAADA